LLPGPVRLLPACPPARPPTCLPACLQPCGLYEGIQYPTKVRWANANESTEEPEVVQTPLQKLLAEPVLVTTPRAGTGAGCLRRCSPPDCAPVPPSSFPATAAAVFSPDCSKVADAAKVWTVKEVSRSWWQLSDGKGSCLTIDAKTPPVFSTYSCEHLLVGWHANGCVYVCA
jgi:hypothetical protein